MFNTLQRTLAILFIVGGAILLLGYMVPGLTYETLWPLAVIAAGIVWLIPNRKRVSQEN